MIPKEIIIRCGRAEQVLLTDPRRVERTCGGCGRAIVSCSHCDTEVVRRYPGVQVDWRCEECVKAAAGAMFHELQEAVQRELTQMLLQARRN